MSSLALLHERTVSVAVQPHGSDRARVHAELRDVRHVMMPSFIGTARPPGVVHHMALDVEVDRALNVAAVDATMHTIPFEPAERTWGEGCRNVLPNYQRLVGARLDGSFALRVVESVGGRLGCFHVLSLAQGLPLAVRTATGRLCGGALRMPRGASDEVRGSCSQWGADSPHWNAVQERDGDDFHPFRRDVSVRADADERKRLRMTAELRDEDGGELRSAMLTLALEAPGFTIAEAGGDLGDAPFSGCGVPLASVQSLVGLSIAKGFTGAALGRIGGPAGCTQLSALVIALAPVVPQASGALAGYLGLAPDERLRRRATSPRADSCHMWRVGGPLIALEEGREGSPHSGEKV